jgi:hypothetical protein
MKKIFKTILLLVSFTAISYFTQAQNSETTKKNIVKVNLLSPLVRTGSFFYERTQSKSSSVLIGVFYIGIPKEVYGLGITPAYRFYLSDTKQAPIGFYVSPYGRFCYLSADNNNRSFNAITAGMGLELGYQWLFKDVVILNIFGGIGYSAAGGSATNNGGDLVESFIIGVDTSRLLGLSLGVAF